MGKWLKRIILLALVAVFLFAVGSLLYKGYVDNQGKQEYADAADTFVAALPQASGTTEEVPPITVDFAALRAANEDVVAWLYCEDTIINYPVLHGDDNDQYLHHLYDGSYNFAGSLFVEAANQPDFSDTNTIIYGHHMKNGTMFGDLNEWQAQEYYEAHPVMWLLTPTQSYRIDILGGYYTSAYSDTYVVFQGSGEEFDTYLTGQLSQSLITTTAAPEAGAHYVLLSTCATRASIEEARFVLHGKLVPVGGAGL